MNRKIIIGIHPDQTGEESYSDKWAEFLRARGVEVRLLDLLAPDALNQARGCHGVMWRWTHTPQHKQSAPHIMYTIERYLGIPVLPDNQTSWHYDEKIAQLYLLQAMGVPMPQTWLFWNQEEALTWAKTAPYPLVFKLSSGAGSSNVLKVNTEAEATGLIKKAFRRGIFPYTMNEFQPSSKLPRNRAEIRALIGRAKTAIRYIRQADYPPLPKTWWKPEKGYVYFQEFVPNNEFDTRITVIGNRAFAYRRLNRPNDFRASGSGNFVLDPDSIDKRCIEIAFRVSHQEAFQSMAYDFLFDNKGEPVICEISYTFVDWMVHECPGYWDSELNWVEGSIWPEEAQVDDFLDRLLARTAQSN